MLDQLVVCLSCQWCSKIDLRNGYLQIRLTSGDEWMATVKTLDGLFEWIVMLFGISNFQSTFMCLLIEILVGMSHMGD